VHSALLYGASDLAGRFELRVERAPQHAGLFKDVVAKSHG
jgi:hypothetical protein